MVYTPKHNYGLFALQSNYTTASTPSKVIADPQSATFTANHELEEIGISGTRLLNALETNGFSGQASIDTNYRNARIFEAVFGTTVSHATGNAPDYVHTLVDHDNSLPVAEEIKSFTYEDGYNSASDVVNVFEGCQVQSITLSVDAKGRLRWSATCPFRQLADGGTVASVTVIPEEPILSAFSCDIKVGTAGSESSIAKVQSAEITFETALIPIFALNTTLKVAEESEDFRVRFRFTIAFSDNTEFNRYRGSSSAVQTTATPDTFGVVLDCDNGIALGSGKKRVLVELRDVLHSNWSNTIQRGTFVMSEFSGIAKTLWKFETTDSISNSDW